MAKKSTKQAKPDMAANAEVLYRLHTLLHTMHAIERHEEKLCALLHEIQSSGKVSLELDEELRDVLEQMPAHEYADDIESVRASLTPGLRKTA